MNGFLNEVEARRRVSEILGTAEERKALRLALGLSLQAVASATGLSAPAVRRREDPAWRMSHGSLDSPAGIAYVRFIAAAKGVPL